jgi:hypothetical protein
MEAVTYPFLAISSHQGWHHTAIAEDKTATVFEDNHRACGYLIAFRLIDIHLKGHGHARVRERGRVRDVLFF